MSGSGGHGASGRRIMECARRQRSRTRRHNFGMQIYAEGCKCLKEEARRETRFEVHQGGGGGARTEKNKMKRGRVAATYAWTASQRATVLCRPPSCSLLCRRSPTVCLSHMLKLHTSRSRVQEASWLSATRRHFSREKKKIPGKPGRGLPGLRCTGEVLPKGQNIRYRLMGRFLNLTCPRTERAAEPTNLSVRHVRAAAKRRVSCDIQI